MDPNYQVDLDFKVVLGPGESECVEIPGYIHFVGMPPHLG